MRVVASMRNCLSVHRGMGGGDGGEVASRRQA
jgi:hypothetical protein